MLLYSDSCSKVEQITGKIGCIMAIYEYQIIHISAPVIFPLKLYTKYTGFDIIKVHVTIWAMMAFNIDRLITEVISSCITQNKRRFLKTFPLLSSFFLSRPICTYGIIACLKISLLRNTKMNVFMINKT